MLQKLRRLPCGAEYYGEIRIKCRMQWKMQNAEGKVQNAEGKVQNGNELAPRCHYRAIALPLNSTNLTPRTVATDENGTGCPFLPSTRRMCIRRGGKNGQA